MNDINLDTKAWILLLETTEGKNQLAKILATPLAYFIAEYGYKEKVLDNQKENIAKWHSSVEYAKKIVLNGI